MSNGQTLARSCLISPKYVGKYPEISHPQRGRYTGPYKYDDYVDSLDSTVSEALLCPTRLFSPVALKVLEKHRADVHGMVHNTGGGNTKCIRLGRKIKYIKDNMPEADPIFSLIKEESGVTWEEMYQDFNMGVGFEFIVEKDSAEEILSVIEGFGVEAVIIGRCEEGEGENSLELSSSFGSFLYT
jgi:phosphoribosylformylglycinamidine cyclo-ligase